MIAGAAPLVSIVVTTRNEEKNIQNCLQSICNQDYGNLEVVIVDNGSIDNTKGIASRFTDLVFDKGPERSAQRNFGLLCVARGEYVAYFDADMLLTPSLITQCVRTIEDRGSGCVGLHIDERILGKTRLSSIRRFERAFFSGTSIDGARFFRRQDLVKIGGFDESLPPGTEDWDLDIRLRRIGELALVNNHGPAHRSWASEFAESQGIDDAETFVGVFHNESELSLAKYLSKKAYYESSLTSYVAKWGEGHEDVRRQLGVLYRLVGVFIENGKWRLLICHPWRYVMVVMLRVVVGLQFVGRKVAKRWLRR